MDIATYVDHIRTDGALLADAAARAGLDASVPTCPEWQGRDPLRHQGDVHRWAAYNLGRGDDSPPSDEESAACLLTWPDDDASLLDWFREGHVHLVETLESIPDDAVAFAFLAAPTARAFWARRQAHETSIHRADAESASGAISPYEPAFAADGIEEMVRGFASRPGRLTSDPPRSLRIRTTDIARGWHLIFTPEGLSVTDDEAPADCAVEGSASDLYLFA